MNEEENQAQLYVIQLATDRIKVGYSATSAARRLAVHRATALAHGGEPGDEWASEQGAGSLERETALVSLCSRQATARFKREYFAGVPFDDAVQYAEEVIAAPDLSIYGPVVSCAPVAMQLAPGERITGIRSDWFDLGCRTLQLTTLEDRADAMGIPKHQLERTLAGIEPVSDEFFAGVQRIFWRVRPDEIFFVEAQRRLSAVPA